MRWPWLRRRAGGEQHPAVTLHLHAHSFEGAESGAFHVARDADADVPSLRPCGAPALGKPLVVGLLQCETLKLGIVAAVVGGGAAIAKLEPDAVGHLLGTDEVAPSQLHRIEVERPRRTVHQPLHEEHRLRPARAPHRRDRNLVRVGDRDLHTVGGQHVGARHRGGADVRHHQAPRHVSAGVVQEMAAQPEQVSFPVERELSLPVLVAFLIGGEEVLTPVLYPLHGTAGEQRAGGNAELLGVEHGLGTEAATDVGSDHPDLMLSHAHHAGVGIAVLVRRLRPRPDGDALARGVVAGEEGAAFHGVAAAAMLKQLATHDVGGAGERSIHVAVFQAQGAGEVVLGIDVGARGVRGQCFAHVRCDRQGFVVHPHPFRCVLGQVAVLGQHDCHGLPGERDLLLHQGVRQRDMTDGAAGHQQRYRLLAQRRRQIVEGEHRVHARHGARLVAVDGADARMGVGASHERRVQDAVHA